MYAGISFTRVGVEYELQKNCRFNIDFVLPIADTAFDEIV